MKRFPTLTAVLAILLAPALALPSTTWTSVSTVSVSAESTTGTEAAPSSATAGMSLATSSRVDVYVCADVGATITAGASKFDVYFYDAAVGTWAKSDLVLSAATGARCAYATGNSPGKGIPILASRGRMAVVPNGATVSAGNITIWLLSVSLSGVAQ